MKKRRGGAGLGHPENVVRGEKNTQAIKDRKHNINYGERMRARRTRSNTAGNKLSLFFKIKDPSDQSKN